MTRKRFSVKDTHLQESIGAMLQEQNQVGEGRIETLPLQTIHTAEENPRYVGRITPAEIRDHRDGKIDLNQEVGDRVSFFESVQDLANSIARRGLLQPIIVREDTDGFKVIAGERRLLAHILLNKERIRAVVRPSAPEMEERAIRLIENLQRENLNFAELIRGIEELDSIFQMENARPMDSTELAAELHKHDSTCRRYLQVMRGPKDVRQAIDHGLITGLRPALALVDVHGEDERALVLSRLKGEAITEVGIKNSPASISPIVQPESRRGRRRTKVNLGMVKNTATVKHLISLLLGEDPMDERFASLDWEDLDQTQVAWDTVIAELDRSIPH